MRAVLLFMDKSKTFSRSSFYKGFLLFCRTCSVANMVAGALTRKYTKTHADEEKRSGSAVVCRSMVAGSSAEECRQDSIAKEGVAHHNYQMSRFLLCYLVYSFLHACFLLGRFIFLGQDKQDGQKDLRSSQ